MPTGFFEEDISTDLMPLLDFTGVTDMWFELDGSGDIEPRTVEADPHFPIEADVKDSILYGYLYEYEGTFAGKSIVSVTTPTLLMADQNDGVNVKATVVGSDVGTTNTIYALKVGTWSWYSLGSRVGDGEITVNPNSKGEWRSFIHSVIDTPLSYGISCNAGEDFWLAPDTTVRERIRDDAARAFLKVAYRLGHQVTFRNPGEAAVILWAVISPSADVTQMRDGVTNQLSITVHIPRQSAFPTSAGFLPGATLKLNDETYQVDSVEADNEDKMQASSWTLRCGKYGYTVELSNS